MTFPKENPYVDFPNRTFNPTAQSLTKQIFQDFKEQVFFQRTNWELKCISHSSKKSSEDAKATEHKDVEHRALASQRSISNTVRRFNTDSTTLQP